MISGKRPVPRVAGLLVVGLATTLAASIAAYAQFAGFGGDRIKLADNFGTLYTTIDRADNKQYREYYANAVALAAAQKGESLPAGSVLTGALFKAKLDEKGDPQKGSDGRFMKDELIGYIVMEKQKGWGATIPAEFRNGEWEFQSFTIAKAVNEKANLKACFECHRDKVGSAKDFLFTGDRIGVR